MVLSGIHGLVILMNNTQISNSVKLPGVGFQKVGFAKPQ
jgi:hypothetical protein